MEGDDPERGGPERDGPVVRSALMASAEAQVVLDHDACLVLANHHATECFGLDGGDLGRPVEDLGLSHLRVDLRVHLEDAREHRGSLWLHDVARAGDESTTYDVEVIPLARGWTVVLHDTTRLRHLQAELGRADEGLALAYEALRRSNEELEQTNEELHEAVVALQGCRDALREHRDGTP